MINRLSTASTGETTAHGYSGKYAGLDDPLGEGQMRLLKLEDVEETDWLAFIAFFQRRWFFRVWTMQEAALAQFLLVRIGALEIDWSHIIACCRSIADSGLWLAVIDLGQEHYRHNDIVFSALIFPAATAMVQGDAEALGMKSGVTAWYGVEKLFASNTAVLDLLLKLMASFRSTDPRDRIFAVAGMMNVIARKHTRRPTPLKADYSKTCSEVYTETMAYMLNDTETLTILAGATPPSLANVAGLPSWVRDLSKPGPQRFLDLHYAFQRSGVLFDASRGRMKGFRIDGRRLHVHILPIAKVAHVGNSLENRSDSKCFEQTAALAIAFRNTIPATGEGPSNFINRIWKTMACDLNDLPDHDRVTDDQMRRGFGAMLMAVQLAAVDLGLRDGRTRSDVLNEANYMSQLAELDHSGTVPSKKSIEEFCEQIGLLEDKIGSYDIEAKDQLLRDAQPFHFQVKVTMFWRRMFLTDGGHIGLGSVDCRPGDELCVVADGGRTPFVVRQNTLAERPDEYTLLGEAYVRGIMHGEAVEDLEAQGRSWREICLV